MSIVIRDQAQKSAQKNRRRGNKKAKAQVDINLKTGPPQKNKKTRKRAKQSSNSGRVPRMLSVHPCVNTYAEVLANPWDSYGVASNVCIPDDTDVPSFKFQVRLRGTMTTNANFGFIAANPISFANSAINSVFFTNSSSFVGTVIPAAAGAPPLGSTYAASNSPFGSTTGITMPIIRPVVFGIRIRYAGTELNRGGSMIPYRSRYLNTSSVAGLGVSDIAGLNQSGLQAAKRKWVGTIWTPISAADRAYRNTTPLSWDINVPASRMLAVAVTAPGVSIPFDYDIIGYYEAVSYTDNAGADAPVPSVSASDSDVAGYSFVRDVYAKLADSEIGQIVWDSLKKSAHTWISSQVPFGAGAPIF